MRKLLLTLTLLIAPAAWAQNGFFYNLDPPAPNATLTVCVLPSPGPAPNPCTASLSAAALFSDAALSVPAANPVQLGPAGTYGFWVAAGQYVVQLSGSVSKSIVITMGGSAGGPGTLPRLDQVLDPNVSKTFNLGTTTLSFSNGTMDLSALTAPLALPSIGSCTPTTGGQICFDSTNTNYLGFNTSLQVFATFPTTVTSGDIAGFLNNAGVLTLQDLGSTTTGGITPGDTFITANITNIREGDSICFDAGSGSFVNCTEGVPVTVISAATYTVDCATDRGAYLLFTSTSPIAVTLPQATTSTTCDANFFTFMRTLSATLTVTPTVSTIDDGGGAGATLVISPAYGTSIFSDNTNYFAKVAPFRKGSNPLLETDGYDVGTVGRYQWQEANGTPATVLNKMVCLIAGVAKICPAASSTTNNPDGSATNGVTAAPGTTGNTGVCSFGFCTVFFDNAATSGHYAQLSSTVDGDLHDTGSTTAPTNGQAFWHVWVSNSGANTTGVVRILTSDELSAAGNNGNGKTTVTVNGTQTQPQANFVDTGCTTWTNTNSGNVTTIGPHVCHGLVFTIGDAGNSSALTVASTTTAYLRVPFACTIKDYSLMIDAGTITVKFWKVATGTAIPTSGNSINTSGVGISSGTAIRSTTVSDFTTTAVAANDFMAMNVTAVATAKFVNGVLNCQE